MTLNQSATTHFFHLREKSRAIQHIRGLLFQTRANSKSSNLALLGTSCSTFAGVFYLVSFSAPHVIETRTFAPSFCVAFTTLPIGVSAAFVWLVLGAWKTTTVTLVASLCAVSNFIALGTTDVTFALCRSVTGIVAFNARVCWTTFLHVAGHVAHLTLVRFETPLCGVTNKVITQAIRATNRTPMSATNLIRVAILTAYATQLLLVALVRSVCVVQLVAPFATSSTKRTTIHTMCVGDTITSKLLAQKTQLCFKLATTTFRYSFHLFFFFWWLLTKPFPNTNKIKNF